MLALINLVSVRIESRLSWYYFKFISIFCTFYGIMKMGCYHDIGIQSTETLRRYCLHLESSVDKNTVYLSRYYSEACIQRGRENTKMVKWWYLEKLGIWMRGVWEFFNYSYNFFLVFLAMLNLSSSIKDRICKFEKNHCVRRQKILGC